MVEDNTDAGNVEAMIAAAGGSGTVVEPVVAEATSEVTPGEAGDKSEGAETGKDDAIEKRFSGMQSMHDKQIAKQAAEHKAEMAEMKGMLKQMSSTQSSASDAQIEANNAKEIAAHRTKWEKILAEDPSRGVEYQQMAARELYDIMTAQNAAELEEMKAELRSEMQSLAPGHKEKQAKAEEVRKEIGCDLPTALKIVDKYEKTKTTVSQPEAEAAPGTVGKGAHVKKDTPKAARMLTQQEIELAKYCNMDDDSINKMAVELGQES